MHHLKSRRSVGFHLTLLHKRKEPHAFHFLAQHTSFWVAVISLFAFVSGNMIGQHGWQVFWKSVLGRDDDSLIVYTGTVTPIALVPDYVRWTKYGGDPKENNFREVPKDLLIPLPLYTPNLKDDSARAIYSVSYMGSYTQGRENTGSHPAVDIRVPIGTPVRAIAGGIVSEVKNAAGFGKTVVLRHPNMPDPGNPGKTTVLFSNYAHLSTVFVTEGATVEKGEQIALSGMSGDATGPHLHFQIDRADAPWHPYWPFTAEELMTVGYTSTEAIDRGFMSDRGTAFTVNPLLYVQADYRPTMTVAAATAVSSTSTIKLSWSDRVKSRIAQRITQRTVTVATVAPAPERDVRNSAPGAASSSSEQTVATERDVVVSRAEPTPSSVASSNVVTLDFSHDGEYVERQWERVRLTLLDAQGNPVKNPILEHDIELRAAYGSADFQPQTLTIFDFHDGRAEVSVLPHGRRALVIEAIPFKAFSQPMRYTK